MSSRHNIVACFENISLNYLRLSSFNHMTDICIKKNPVIATIIGPSKFDLSCFGHKTWTHVGGGCSRRA